MTPINIFGVSQLLTILPFQFGFHPQRCLVVASFADGLVAAMRVEQDSLLSLPVGTATSLMLAQAQRSNAERIVLIDYETGCPAETLAEIATACERAGCGVPHVLHVRAQTWWASRCVHGCCDGTLTPIPAPRDVPATAEFILRGVAPAPSREAAIAGLRERHPSAQWDVNRAFRSIAWDPALAMEEWQHLCSLPGNHLTSADAHMVAAVLIGMDDRWTRDEFLATLVPELVGSWDPPMAPIPRAQSRRVAEVLRQTLAQVPDEHRATWLVFVALARWRSGDVTGAYLAAGEAYETEQEQSLTQLVLQLLSLQTTYDDFVGTDANLDPTMGDGLPQDETAYRPDFTGPVIAEGTPEAVNDDTREDDAGGFCAAG